MTFACQFCQADYHHEGEVGVFVGVCPVCGVERCGPRGYQAAIDRAEITIARGDARRGSPAGNSRRSSGS